MTDLTFGLWALVTRYYKSIEDVDKQLSKGVVLLGKSHNTAPPISIWRQTS